MERLSPESHDESSLNRPGPKAGDIHRPVLLGETLANLNLSEGSIYIDVTLGLGGHSEAILTSTETAKVIGIDRDGEALKIAKARLEQYGRRFSAIRANFTDITEVARKEGLAQVDGILADLGVSSLQFDSENRGFSFRFDAPLDMRMDASPGNSTAAELLETLDETEIANILYRFGEERRSRRIARKIVERREAGCPVTTTFQLADLVERTVGRKRGDKIHPATRTFQALRIAVNDELVGLAKFIEDSIALLKIGGRLCMITFHSLEDRIVKRTFQRLSGHCFCPPKLPACVCGAVKVVEVLTRKPIVPGEKEVAENPRSRSAKLRVCKKISEF